MTSILTGTIIDTSSEWTVNVVLRHNGEAYIWYSDRQTERPCLICRPETRHWQGAIDQLANWLPSECIITVDLVWAKAARSVRSVDHRDRTSRDFDGHPTQPIRALGGVAR